MAERFSDFKTARRWNGLNRLLQVLLSISLVLGLNYLVLQTAFHTRWDLSGDQRQMLSLETRKYLESVAHRVPEGRLPWVRAYVTLSPEEMPNEELAQQVRPLLRQLNRLADDFSFAANQEQRVRGWFKVEAADRVKNAGVWTELNSRFAPVTERTALVVVCEQKGKYEYIDLADLVRNRKSGDGRTEIDLFRGEEVLINALLRVTDDKSPVVYLTTGHGEKSRTQSGDQGLSLLELKLRNRNMQLKELDLLEYNEVPTDASMVMIAGPLTAFMPQEVEKLRRYMRERSGRVLAFVDVGAKYNLDDLFYDWGILVDDAQVWETPGGGRDPSQALLLGVREMDHPLTQQLRTTGVPLEVGMARPVRYDLAGPMDDTLQVFELVGTSAKDAWGERDYRHPPFTFNFERGDIPAPVSVAVVAERVAGRKQNINIPAGRMLVFGSSDVVSNARINSMANSFFLLNAVNWMLDRDQFLNIPPRPLPEFHLQATNSDLGRVGKTFLLLPGMMLLLGAAVFLWRRST